MSFIRFEMYIYERDTEARIYIKIILEEFLDITSFKTA